MKLGVFGARADNRGLAAQSLDYVRHLPVTRAYGVDMQELSPYPNDWRPYESLPIDLTINRIKDIDEASVRRWAKGLDVVLAAETFYRDEAPDWFRDINVRTVQHANREFCPWTSDPPDRYNRNPPPCPDVIALPTPWLIDSVPGAVHLPMGVDRIQFPFNLRTSANRFVHVAGHRAASDRAGTRLVLAATSRNNSPELIIRSQSELGIPPRGPVTVEIANVSDRRELINDADVLVLPRRYGGNSLIHNEALSSGIPVISLDRSPENTWGGVLTVPARDRQKLRTKGGLISVSDAHPTHLLSAMVQLAADPIAVERLSYDANEYARTISWDRLEGRYMDLFKSLL